MKDYVYSSILKKEFVDFLKVRQAQGFRDKNDYIFQSLDRYLSEQNVADKELSCHIVDGWLAKNSVNRSDNTLGHYTSCATVFGKYLITLGFNAFIPEYRGRTASYVPYIFSAEEVDAIFNVADNMDFGNVNSRFQFPMLLRLLYGSGLRLGEALALRHSDIDTENGFLQIWNAKGNRDRLVPLDAALMEVLAKYCAVLQKKSSDSLLFPGELGQIRYERWSHTLFQKLLCVAGIHRPQLPRYARGICLHCFRHTFAVNSFRKQDLAGIDVYSAAPLLAIYLGHTKLAVTQRYLHMTAENSEDILSITNGYSQGLFPEVPL